LAIPAEKGAMSVVAVLDVGKTNVKLTAATRGGDLIETVSLPNAPAPGPPYLHIAAARIGDWLLDELAALARRHRIGAFVATGHGSAAGLVDDAGLAMPMIDYEAEVPAGITAAYLEAAGPLAPLGSPLMAGAAHMARQLFWLEADWPEAVAGAKAFLGGPQYWAWLLSGGTASELTFLGAQSQLRDFAARTWAPIVAARGWQHLLPPPVPAWHPVGRIRPALAARHGLPPDIDVLCGIHDSSANFYRFQEAGLTGLTLISTGTWIVGMSDEAPPEAGLAGGYVTRNMDVHGNPLSGILAMGGREFATIAGDAPEGPVAAAEVAALVAAGTMALPSFADQDGAFPGSAGKGRIEGPEPASRRALALLYVALLTDACLERLGARGTVVLDGSFTRDPLYAGLVQALRPGVRVLVNTDAYGAASGAALLADHERRTGPAPVALTPASRADVPGLATYRDRWRRRAESHAKEAGTT
jgi:sugar (pentulose or hexulose) kinase